MAFKDLDGLRTAKLNPDLGIASGDDAEAEPWGDTTVRNTAIIDTISRMWPRMALHVVESLTIVTDAVEYNLTTIEELIGIRVKNSSGQVYKEIKNFRSWVDRSAATPVGKVLLSISWSAGTTETLEAEGYRPFTVPATGSDTLDIPPEWEWIVMNGARAYLYRRRFNQWVDFEGYQATNRDNATSPSELFSMYQDAERQFESALDTHGRRTTVAKTARLRRRR